MDRRPRKRGSTGTNHPRCKLPQSPDPASPFVLPCRPMRPRRIAAPLAFALAATLASSQALAVRAPEHGRVSGLEVAEGIRPVRPAIQVSYTQIQIPKARKAAW